VPSINKIRCRCRGDAVSEEASSSLRRRHLRVDVVVEEASTPFPLVAMLTKMRRRHLGGVVGEEASSPCPHRKK